MGIPDHVWKDKRETLANTIDKLSEQEFRAHLRQGWLSYLNKMFPDGAPPPATTTSFQTSSLYVEED